MLSCRFWRHAIWTCGRRGGAAPLAWWIGVGLAVWLECGWGVRSSGGRAGEAPAPAPCPNGREAGPRQAGQAGQTESGPEHPPRDLRRTEGPAPGGQAFP